MIRIVLMMVMVTISVITFILIMIIMLMIVTLMIMITIMIVRIIIPLRITTTDHYKPQLFKNTTFKHIVYFFKNVMHKSKWKKFAHLKIIYKW